MKTAWIGLAIVFGAATTAAAADLQPETITKTVLGEFQRIYVADPTLPHMPDGRVYVLDGADMKLKGMMESGFAGMMAAAPEKHRVYVATTFYERISRGKRTDVVQVFDDQHTVRDRRNPAAGGACAGAALSQPVHARRRPRHAADPERDAGDLGHRSSISRRRRRSRR